MKFSRKEYWSGWPFLSPGDPPDAGIEPGSRADSSSSEPLGKPLHQKRDLYSPLVHPCRLLTHKYHLQCWKCDAALLLRLHHKGQCGFSCALGHMFWYSWITMYEVQLPWSNHQVRKLRPRVHTPVGSRNQASSQLPTKPASQVSKSSWTSNPRIQAIQTFLWLQLVQMCIIPAISLLSIYRKETKILHDKPQVKTACTSTSEFLAHQRIKEIKFVFTKFGGNVVQL